jgi:hypothetical protein
MSETESENGSKVWKKFLKMHWNVVVSFVIGAILVSIGAVLLFFWFVGHAQSTGLVPATLDLWTMGNVVTFILHVILWEVPLIGAAIVLVVIAWLWWRKLPDDERKEYERAHIFGTPSKKSSGGGGAISLLVNIAFCIKVFTDGNWDVAFATWTFDYLVYSYLSALIWVLIIFGIPMVLGGLLWIGYEIKKKP